MSTAATTMQPPLAGLRRFLVDYRVVISVVLFTSLILGQVYIGLRPRAWSVGGDLQGMFGAALVIVGLVIRSWAAGMLIKGKKLATVGPYSLCKHPLYLGSFSMMLGFCLVMDNPLHLVAVLCPVAVIYWVTMLNEERNMLSKFGDSWVTYSAKVPRFFPWRWAQYQHVPFTYACWVRNHEYRAVLSAIAGLVALEVWHHI